uniref:alanine--glyoxylate transaminase n=1 Tax=Paulinella chromatophora TaxID=39717 RepID=B1X4J6_PAUCH|nr:soluble hydrogenase small subunit [Paulinella chromatophora]ACB42865.1 soluble hydrogenase small subunit [Paulinella chromatophora]
MQDKLSLMIPGPTPVPETVLRAISRHTISHRSYEFETIFNRINKKLQWLHQTQSNVISITGSGTAAIEAGIINTLKSGDKVLCGDNGKFGERWVEVAHIYNLDIEVIRSPWGKALDPEAFRIALENDTTKLIKAVILTHSETSTGIINDLSSINHYIKSHGVALSIVDCVTSVGVCDIPIDTWGIDVVCSGSQKGYMMPPGLAFIAMSKNASEAQKRSDLPKFYLDLKYYQKTAIKNSNPFTPAVNLYFALDAALEMMHTEGLESIFKRHKRHSKAIQLAIKTMGLSLYAEEGHESPAVTTVAPIYVDAELVRTIIKERFNILLAGGQGQLNGKVFRIGHLGFICDRDIIATIAALEVTLKTMHPDRIHIGQAVAAAMSALV